MIKPERCYDGYDTAHDRKILPSRFIRLTKNKTVDYVFINVDHISAITQVKVEDGQWSTQIFTTDGEFMVMEDESEVLDRIKVTDKP